MNWQDRTFSDPETLFDKPLINAMQIGIECLLDLLSSDWIEAQILENYPHFKPNDLQTVFAFVRDCGLHVRGYDNDRTA